MNAGSTLFRARKRERWRFGRCPPPEASRTDHQRRRLSPEESLDGKLLYYGKYETHGLWCTPIAGGEERQILNSVLEGSWTIGSGGIYYFDFPRAGRTQTLKFYSFQSGRSTQIGTVETTVLSTNAGFSVSPDGRWLLYTEP